jgi:hypothetical protein
MHNIVLYVMTPPLLRSLSLRANIVLLSSLPPRDYARIIVLYGMYVMTSPLRSLFLLAANILLYVLTPCCLLAGGPGGGSPPAERQQRQ